MSATMKWEPIKDSPGYIVSSVGDVEGPNGPLKPIRSKDGYLYIFIHRKKRLIHRLVLETFIGLCPKNMECRHLDGNPENNQLSNLTWGTRRENVNDRRLHGTMPIPHESSFTHLKPEDIPGIRKMHELGFSTRFIGSEFGTSHVTIQKILRGERWKGY